MREIELSTWLELRLLVGYLGEKTQHGWWPSEFFSPISMQFLQPVFTRTARLAQYNGVLAAARRTHDACVGIGHVFHLFRLPAEIEQDLHRQASGLHDDHPLLENVESLEKAAARLAAIAGDRTPVSEGPIAIGTAAELQKPAAAKKLAGHYVIAFEKGKRVYPYFTS